jgi:hypothetical protein
MQRKQFPPKFKEPAKHGGPDPRLKPAAEALDKMMARLKPKKG